MNIRLSDHFTYGRLLRFTLPSILMMIFSSIYGVVDGLLISNYVGAMPFASINFIIPIAMILGAVGFMIGSGGSALVSATLGKGDTKKANEIFSMLIYALIAAGTIFTVLGVVLMRPLVRFLGATESMLPCCVAYGRVAMIGLTPFMLQNVSQSFLITAERPDLGLGVTVAAGIVNIVLDVLFMAVFRWGVVGAAVATAISECIGGLIPLAYFVLPNKSKLRLGKTRYDGCAFARTCANGSSEFMSFIAAAIVSMIYNIRLMSVAGENGVAAYGVIMYIDFGFLSVFLGYSNGVAPVVGFHYGADNHEELKGLLRKSLVVTGLFSVALTVAAERFVLPLVRIFVGYDAELLSMSARGLALHSFSFLLAGFNILGSAFFTALNNGLISAVISFGRTLVFQAGAVLTLPFFLSLDGIWLAAPVTEALTLIVTVWFFVRNRTKYRYY